MKTLDRDYVKPKRIWFRKRGASRVPMTLDRRLRRDAKLLKLGVVRRT